MGLAEILLGLLVIAFILLFIHYIYSYVTKDKSVAGDKYDLAWSDTINRCQLEDLTGLPRVRPYTLESDIYSTAPAH